MQIKCENCGAAIRADDVHEELALARCAHCDGILDLTRRQPANDDGGPRRRARVPLPEKFMVDEAPGRFSISWRWFSFIHAFLVFFCFAWNSFLVFWYSAAFTNIGEGGPLNLMMIVFPLGHVAAGIAITYFTLAGFLNRTTVEVTSGVLRIRHAPLPWKGNREIPAHEVAQLFCEEKRSRSKNGHVVRTYHLSAVLGQEQRKVSLLKLEGVEQAVYLEQKLEEVLGIADRAVAGEMTQVS